MKKELLKKLSRIELFVLAAEAKSTNDQELVDEITDELKERNKEITPPQKNKIKL